MAKAKKKILGDEVVHYDPPRKRRKGSVRPNPNLVPMVDVCFNLLLFCVLGFSFRQPEGAIPGSLPPMGIGPGGEGPPVEVRDPIRITVSPRGADGVLFEVQGAQQAAETPIDLYRNLMARQQVFGTGGAEVPIIIQIRPNVQWRWATEAFNQCVRAKFKQVGFAS